MNKYLLGLLVGVMSFVLANQAEAQVAYVTYYAPAMPVTTYYAPPETPVVQTSYYAPVPAAPVVQTSYYAPAPAVAYRPVPVATTRYRPILGGTVTRIRTGYAPVVVNPMPVVYGY
jgi:hypothetical protein